MNKELIVNALHEIQTDSQEFRKTHDLLAMYNKYGIFFLGEDLNTILSNELITILQKHFQISFDPEELIKDLPNLCSDLNITCEPVAELFGNTFTSYQLYF